ncbi:MAG: hypothetical protein NZ922_06295 [Candidatus Methanomethyliaceae archaeon]|nr:hypothetical protein [Candidatus Methanomethyliaceae archaeon]MDW7971289.1 hypothetical protein [Nitrososphaerota archaeon]
MIDMISMMNIVIIFTMFLAAGVLIVVFYEIIKINFNKIKESSKERKPQKEVPSFEDSGSMNNNQLLSDNQPSDSQPSEIINENKNLEGATPVEKANPSESKNAAVSESIKTDDVEALLKGASKEQSEEELKKGLINTKDSKIDQLNQNSKIEKLNQVNEKISEKESEKIEQLSEVENLLKTKQPKDEALEISKQLYELNEYVKKLRDSLRSFTKSE